MRVLTLSLIPRRQSSRLIVKLRFISILHSLKTNYKPQNLFEQLLIDLKISYPVKDVLYTHLLTSGLIEVSPPVLLKTQFQS
jgi:hypothetical protein